jgi:hypothetical protein
VNEAKTEVDLNEKEIFAHEVPDEILEAAACLGPENARAFTVAMCTGLAECPY